MNAWRDLRTPDQIMGDMLADEQSFEQIAARLGWNVNTVRARFHTMRQELGWQAK